VSHPTVFQSARRSGWRNMPEATRQATNPSASTPMMSPKASASSTIAARTSHRCCRWPLARRSRANPYTYTAPNAASSAIAVIFRHGAREAVRVATSGKPRNSSQIPPINQPKRSHGEGAAGGEGAASVMAMLRSYGRWARPGCALAPVRLVPRSGAPAALTGLLAGAATAHQQERGDSEDDRPAHQVHQRDPQAVALHRRAGGADHHALGERVPGQRHEPVQRGELG